MSCAPKAAEFASQTWAHYGTKCHRLPKGDWDALRPSRSTTLQALLAVAEVELATCALRAQRRG